MLLAYDDDGPGPVLVLLHGFPLDRTIWAPQQSSIGAIYRVIAPDLRGFGQSASPEGVATMDLMADDVIELLNALQLTEPVVLGGLSMGGYVAFNLMERYPERFRALILIDTRAAADTPAAAQGREELARTVETTRSTRAVVDAMLPKFFSNETRSERGDRIPPIIKMMERAPVHGVAAALRGMASRPDRTGDLAGIKVPTLVMVGDHDAIAPPAEAEAMARGIPGGRLAIIPGAGHLAPWENPKAADEAILGFLNTLE